MHLAFTAFALLSSVRAASDQGIEQLQQRLRGLRTQKRLITNDSELRRVTAEIQEIEIKIKIGELTRRNEDQLLRGGAQRSSGQIHNEHAAQDGKRALIVTVCGSGSKSLESTVEDAGKMISFLQSRGYNIIWLKDFQYQTQLFTDKDGKEHIINQMEKDGENKVPNRDPAMEPTEENIRRVLKEMARQTNEGDECFFYYSGHGINWHEAANVPASQINCFQRTGMRAVKLFTDKKFSSRLLVHRTGKLHSTMLQIGMPAQYIYDDFTSQLPSGSKAILMFDCCMSGSKSGLRYRLNHDGDKWQDKTKTGGVVADVLSISACDDHELAEDALFTRTFLKAVNFLDDGGRDNEPGSTNLSYTLKEIKERLTNGYRGLNNNVMNAQIEAYFPII